jgi:hypothetical protein
MDRLAGYLSELIGIRPVLSGGRDAETRIEPRALRYKLCHPPPRRLRALGLDLGERP